jgi:ABC-2 type transport system ATP-binding protein
MTVEEYLLYRLKLRGESSMRQRRRLKGALEICDLEEVANSIIRSLSQGYKKRIGLADALMQHPRLLLLDDPLAGLDINRRKKIGTALTGFSAHAAVLLAGHEIREMLDWCTRFIVLKEGVVDAIYRSAEHKRSELERLLRQGIGGADEGGAQ